jgi:hypothetical protein
LAVQRGFAHSHYLPARTNVLRASGLSLTYLAFVMSRLKPRPTRSQPHSKRRSWDATTRQARRQKSPSANTADGAPGQTIRFLAPLGMTLRAARRFLSAKTCRHAKRAYDSSATDSCPIGVRPILGCGRWKSRGASGRRGCVRP